MKFFGGLKRWAGPPTCRDNVPRVRIDTSEKPASRVLGMLNDRNSRYSSTALLEDVLSEVSDVDRNCKQRGSPTITASNCL